jgi:hypothetical protein
MKRSTSDQHRQAQWRERVARQAQSDLSVAAFCKSEGIPAQTFYWWRARLGKAGAAKPAQGRRDTAPFIDLGALSPSVDEAPDMAAGFDLRLDLPGGIVLTIARR